MENETGFQKEINSLRTMIKGVASRLDETKRLHVDEAITPSEDRGEVMANLMLSYRHLEDASMRLGKVLQAYDGGVSCYDKKTTVGCPIEGYTTCSSN